MLYVGLRVLDSGIVDFYKQRQADTVCQRLGDKATAPLQDAQACRHYAARATVGLEKRLLKEQGTK